MRSVTCLLLALSATTYAQPLTKAQENDLEAKYSWAPVLQSYYQAVGKHVAEIRTTRKNILSIPCDLSQAVQPVAPSPLPTPSLTLTHVAIGRGTQVSNGPNRQAADACSATLTDTHQNYTCQGKAPTDAPVALGAVASLYNASCFAATYPDLLALGPGAALQFPYPTENKASLPPSNLELSGHHYFTDATTPAFDLDTKADRLGYVLTKKLTSTPAPPLADGQSPVGYGNVAWLLLEAKAGSHGTIQQVYRLNTAGGNPPKTCNDQPEFFEEQYAAEYWFYS